MNSQKKPTMYIIYSFFLDKRGEKIIIGGIQQYILSLIDTFKEDFNIEVIQKSGVDFHKRFNDYKVKGYSFPQKNIGKQLYKMVENSMKPDDFVIWASDRISVKTKHVNTVSIQHGITFDFIDYDNIKYGKWLKKSLNLSILYRLLQQYNAIKFFLRTPKVVCVDYNFLNWARVMLPRKVTDKVTVIPNYSKLPDRNKGFDRKGDNIKILFARRFVEYRGVYILSEIIDYFSKNYSHVFFGVFGEGPLEKYLVDKFSNFNNVTISSYEAEEAHKILFEYDISIIPTYGSEGTSLSLLESMSCECVPITSNIGGMTNVIIDGYNGFLVNPNSEEFIDKIEYLINNPEEMKRVRETARKSIEHGFMYDFWQEKWRKVINNS